MAILNSYKIDQLARSLILKFDIFRQRQYNELRGTQPPRAYAAVEVKDGCLTSRGSGREGVCIAPAGNLSPGGDTYYSSRSVLDCVHRLDFVPGV